MDGRRQPHHEPLQSRHINSPASSEAKRKGKPPKASPSNIRKGPIKMRGGATASLHRTAGQVQGLPDSVVGSQNKIEKERNNQGRPKKQLLVKPLSRTYSSDKLRPRRQPAARLVDESDNQDGFSEFQQYFLFDNRIIPIVNSDQKRVVDRFINDSMSTQDKEWKHLEQTCDGLHPKREVRDCEVMTESKSVGERFTQTEAPQPRTANQQTLTDPQTAPPVSEPVKVEKHQQVSAQSSYVARRERQEPTFDQVLSKLQFLYLPEERHFQNLTAVEREHYKDLFLMLADKLAPKQSPKKQQITSVESMEESAIMFHQTNHEIALLIQQRIAQQMSCAQPMSDQGIPTNLVSIIGYLSNLFCFLDMRFKDGLLKGVNTPYGLYNNQRFYMVSHGKKPTNGYDLVLPESIYEEFEQQFFSGQGEDSLIMQAVHSHNRAVFDSLNDELNLFRPFYSCRGQPYIWYFPGSMTFFSIKEGDIDLVLEKAKVKVLEHASYLCGLHCDHRSLSVCDQHGRRPDNILLKDVRMERERKLMLSTVHDVDESYQVEDFRTALLLQFSEILLAKLLHEESCLLMSIFSA